MPNDCHNTLVARHLTPAQAQRIIRACAPRTDSLGRPTSFSSLLSEFVPVPPDTSPLDVWGTKWDAYEVDCSHFSGGVSVEFQTAWGPPSADWVEALSAAMPKAHITLNYTEESGDFAGKTVAHKGVAVDKVLPSIQEVCTAWVERTQSNEVKAILYSEFDDEEDELYDRFQETEDAVREEWSDVMCDELDDAIDALAPFPSLYCQMCLRHAASLVLGAAAACPIFGRRGLHAQYLQPPAQLGLKPSLELVSMQLRCRDNSQRVRLLCCSCPLSILAFRLAGAVEIHGGGRGLQHRVVAQIMKRCFSVLAWRLWIGRKCENDGDDDGDDDYDDDDDGDGDDDGGGNDDDDDDKNNNNDDDHEDHGGR